jgi:hypothetical protein
LGIQVVNPVLAQGLKRGNRQAKAAGGRSMRIVEQCLSEAEEEAINTGKPKAQRLFERSKGIDKDRAILASLSIPCS